MPEIVVWKSAYNSVGDKREVNAHVINLLIGRGCFLTQAKFDIPTVLWFTYWISWYFLPKRYSLDSQCLHMLQVYFSHVRGPNVLGYRGFFSKWASGGLAPPPCGLAILHMWFPRLLLSDRAGKSLEDRHERFSWVGSRSCVCITSAHIPSPWTGRVDSQSCKEGPRSKEKYVWWSAGLSLPHPPRIESYPSADILSLYSSLLSETTSTSHYERSWHLECGERRGVSWTKGSRPETVSLMWNVRQNLDPSTHLVWEQYGMMVMDVGSELGL